jgi:plastocyanin
LIEMKTRGLAAIAAIVLLGAFGLAGCGDDDPEQATEEPTSEEGAPADVEDLTGEATITVEVPDNSFSPPDVAIDAGTEVTWSNIGRNEHNVTPNEEGAFEGVSTEDFQPGTDYSTTFDEPGIYGYYCTIHGAPGAGQVGSITVVDPDGGS